MFLKSKKKMPTEKPDKAKEVEESLWSLVLWKNITNLEKCHYWEISNNIVNVMRGQMNYLR